MIFPEKLDDRYAWIEERVLVGNFEARWSEIATVVDGKEIRLRLMDDALKIEGVRVNVSALLSQRLADYFDASLPTAMVADMMYAFATRRATPCPRPISSSVAAMVVHSSEVEKQVGPGPGLAATVGKHWVLDKQLEGRQKSACNYGWHFPGTSFQGISGFPVASKGICSGVKVIQPNATAHDNLHSDYSQICQLVSQTCWIDGAERRFSEVLTHPIDAYLVSHQGPLAIVRQPGSDPIVGKHVMFPITVEVENAQV